MWIGAASRASLAATLPDRPANHESQIADRIRSLPPLVNRIPLQFSQEWRFGIVPTNPITRGRPSGPRNGGAV
jgi:hypothetical protein